MSASQEPTNNHTNQQSQLKKDFRDPISPGEIFFKDAELTSGQSGKATKGGLCDSFGLAFFLKGGKTGTKATNKHPKPLTKP